MISINSHILLYCQLVQFSVIFYWYLFYSYLICIPYLSLSDLLPSSSTFPSMSSYIVYLFLELFSIFLVPFSYWNLYSYQLPKSFFANVTHCFLLFWALPFSFYELLSYLLLTKFFFLSSFTFPLMSSLFHHCLSDWITFCVLIFFLSELLAFLTFIQNKSNPPIPPSTEFLLCFKLPFPCLTYSSNPHLLSFSPFLWCVPILPLPRCFTDPLLSYTFLLNLDELLLYIIGFL